MPNIKFILIYIIILILILIYIIIFMYNELIIVYTKLY